MPTEAWTLHEAARAEHERPRLHLPPPAPMPARVHDRDAATGAAVVATIVIAPCLVLDPCEGNTVLSQGPSS